MNRKWADFTTILHHIYSYIYLIQNTWLNFRAFLIKRNFSENTNLKKTIAWDKQILNFTSSFAEESSPLIESGVYKDYLSEIGSYSWIRRESIIESSQCSSDVFIGFRVEIYNSIIDKGCLIASQSIIGVRHGEKVKIGPYVWIGAKVTIDEGVTIAQGAVIGAGAHVRDDVPSNTIVIGRPARQIRKRNILDNKTSPNFRVLLKNIKHRLKTNKDLVRSLLELTRSYSGEISETYTDILKKDLHTLCSMGVNNFFDADMCLGLRVKFGNSIIAIGKQIKDEDGNLLLDGGIQIGDDVIIGNYTILEGGGKISIGSNTQLGKAVHIVSITHNMESLALPIVAEPVKIGTNVQIGDNSLILSGVSIRDGVVIPSGAILTKNVFFDKNFNEIYRENAA